MPLIILVLIAGVILYQLYAVLGRRVGRQPDQAVAPSAAPVVDEAAPKAPDPHMLAPPAGLAAVRARDPNFDVGRFLQGARVAYEAIVRAFSAGDRQALERLTTPAVMVSFSQALDAREAEGRSQSVEFTSPARADLDNLEVEGDLVRGRVRFLAELRTRSKGPEGEAVDDQRTAELWTFERLFSSADPNWTLARVDAAQA